jgi:beta-glucanase (GH16 family)
VENAVLANNGLLTIEAKRERDSGYVHTPQPGSERKYFKIFSTGILRLRLSFHSVKGSGLLSGLCLHTSYNGGWPLSGEIDIMENIGSEPSTVHGKIHYGDPWPDNSWTSRNVSLLDDEPFSDAFHMFAVDKEPGVIRWALDGGTYSEMTPDNISSHIWHFDE